MLLCHGPNPAFLVPGSCIMTGRKGHSICADVTDDVNETIRTTKGSLFYLFLKLVQILFFMFYDNVCILYF